MITIPAWIDPDAWHGFEQMRRSMHKVPFTDRAKALILADLYRIKEAGYCANASLDQSTLNGWRGVFVPKSKDIPQAPKAQIAATNKYLQDYEAHSKQVESQRKGREPIKLVRRG